ncbi:Kinesin-like protein KIN-UA [Camellia lanceoleosa]|uniref:Kinesin-like protein KIN-UA n=1 Tax=Camellia lanceoleosa TaxID=1840588 RepID=A0ACC0FI89_9ERIC|nr:Kinesin-like protein KIN-UA [Camellia lanceoleosa]
MHSWSIPPFEDFDCHECYGVEKFEISSIGLTTFEYIGKVKNFSFLDVPWLEKVHIKFMVAYERGTQYMFNGIANDLPRLQNLSLVLTTDEVLPIPARITRFNSLKQLELFVMVSSDFNLLSLTLLLNASPLLQKLHLSLHTGRSRGQRIEQQYSKLVHCELKEVEVHGFLGRSNEMELAIYLLKNAVSLERMILSTQKRLYHGGGKWMSSWCPWFEWHTKKACAYDLLQKEKLYLEYIQDLLAPEKINIPIVEDPKTGEVTLPGAVVVKIRDLDHFFQLLQTGEANRHAANPKMNRESSHSHAILMVHVRRAVHEEDNDAPFHEKDSKRDLSNGSEGHLLEEAKFINLSLTSLGKCINALAENSPHIPIRDSKLTRLLHDSFGGSVRTSFIVTIGPSSQHHAETSSTIMFGQRDHHYRQVLEG